MTNSQRRLKPRRYNPSCAVMGRILRRNRNRPVTTVVIKATKPGKYVVEV